MKPVHFQKKCTGFFGCGSRKSNTVSSRIESAVHQGATKSIWTSVFFVPQSSFLMFFLAVFQSCVFRGVRKVWLIYVIFMIEIRGKGPWSIIPYTAHDSIASNLLYLFSVSQKKPVHSLKLTCSFAISSLFSEKTTVSITNCLRQSTNSTAEA